MGSDGRAIFCQCIGKLLSDSLISPVGRKPDLADGLHSKYRICKTPKRKDEELANQIIREITPPAGVDFYLKNPDLYLEDREVIEKIIRFLNQASGDIVTVNERSYQLFGDEKFFSRGWEWQEQRRDNSAKTGAGLSGYWLRRDCRAFFQLYVKGFSLDNRQVYIYH